MNKLLTMAEAINRHVPDGASVAIGMALEAAIPFAAGHEMIRQSKRDLALIGPISDMLFDQLIGAGCVRAISAAWVGNVNVGSGYAFRRAVENQQPHELEIRDYSNLTMALALTAASLGAPFIPTHSVLGSELSSTNTDLIERINPLNEAGEPLLLVRALQPDVAVIHVQRASPDGGAHLWGNLGLCREAALAARQIILVAEEIVSAEVIRSDPNRVLVPPFRVSAVVHEPGAAHPAPVQGYYHRDHAIYDDYAKASQSEAGLQEWMDRWVHRVDHRANYLQALGQERWQALQVHTEAFAAPVNYG
jgi:glutaconate CoA-transferase, subunit A